MKLFSLTFCLIVSCITACTWKVPPPKNVAITNDTLNYTYKTFKERASDCGTKPDSGCTVIKFVYPVFKSQLVLNDSVIHKLIAHSGSKKIEISLKQVAKNFLSDYTRSIKKLNNPPIYKLYGNTKIIRQDSSLITLETATFCYTGGIHPLYNTQFLNWNTKTNKKIDLPDLLKDNKQDSLKEIAEGIFRKNEKLYNNASLYNDYFFKNGKFALNNNYLITPSGIRFFYNQHEIKPYEAGITDLFIPYGEIKSLLRPNSIVTQYIK